MKSNVMIISGGDFSPLYHVVKAGENLTRIAAKYGKTVDDILSLNPDIVNPDYIKAGQTLAISNPETDLIESAIELLREALGNG